MRPVPSLLALALGALAAVAVACGESGSSAGLLRDADASALKSELDAVDAAVAENDCGATEAALNRVGSAIRNLPESTDDEVRRRLGEGYADLRSRALEDCEEPREETTTVETTTTTTPAPEPTTTQEAPVAPAPTTTATPPPAQTTPPPAQTTPEGTGGVEPGEEEGAVTPGNGNGNGGGNGNGNGDGGAG